MRFVGVLENIAGSKAKARVLSVLLKFQGKQWTGRQLALQAKVSQPQSTIALGDLKQEGLAQAVNAGKATLWSLNQSHFLVKNLEPLAKTRECLSRLLLEKLGEKLDLNKVERITLFGSVARGEERQESDIDVLIVVKTDYKKTAREKTLDAANELTTALGGNTVIPVIYSASEFKRKKNSPLMKNVSKEGITIYEA